MIFTQAIFPIFLCACLGIYWTLRSNTSRQIFLLAASFFFYGYWDWRFLTLLSLVIIIAWITPRLCDKYEAQRKRIMALSITALLCQLAIFKYFNFFIDSFEYVLFSLGIETSTSTLSIILPVGISFFTFQAISFIVDTNRKHIANDTNLLSVSLYIAFFPQLVAGPIVRAVDFIPQLAESRKFDTKMITKGMALFVLGFVYKAVVSDNVAPFVDQVFSTPEAFDSISVIAGTMGFYAQIYFDFAGYSTMAIGIAYLFGYSLCDNFNYPYASFSIVDFWRRWHMSLSSWLRDYLYIAVGGNRGGELMRYRNLFITMILGGLWHGASWAFVLWGTLHGIALTINHFWSAHVGNKLPDIWITTINYWFITQLFVLLCWIPFRSENLGDAWIILTSFIPFQPETGQPLTIPWALILLPLIIDTITKPSRHIELMNEKNPVGLASMSALIFAIALVFMQTDVQAFIYFQF